MGKIDLIVIDDQKLVFVKVKQRRERQFDRPKIFVGRAKQDKLRRTEANYLQCNDRSKSGSGRFGVVSITSSPQAPICH